MDTDGAGRVPYTIFGVCGGACVYLTAEGKEVRYIAGRFCDSLSTL